MKAKVLVLGGSTEAGEICRTLTEQGNVDVIVSLAGATQYPRESGCMQRSGGFGGISGLRAYLQAQKIAAVIDATHPYAQQMKRNAYEACASLALARVACVRAPWTQTEGDNWLCAPTSADAAHYVAQHAQWRCVFLSIGRRDMTYFRGIDCRWLIRVIDEPTVLPNESCVVVRARGPFTYEDERALLLEHRVEALVSRNSGGAGTRAKLDAARSLGLPVVMIDPPPPPQPPHVASVAEVLTWLETQGLGQKTHARPDDNVGDQREDNERWRR